MTRTVSVDIGAKLKRLRKDKQLTLQHVARRMNLTPSYISRLERNLCYPALETLYELARFFGKDISFFFRHDEIREDQGRVLQNQARPVMSLLGGRLKGRPYANIKYSDPSVEALACEQTPKSGEVKLPHFKAQGCLLILKGTVAFTLSGERHVLRSGDSIYYSCQEPRSIRTLGKRGSLFLVAIHPPKYTR